MAKMTDEKKAAKAAEKKAKEAAAKAVAPSLDEEIGKGLTPKKAESNLDQVEKDFELHPKFAKFKK